ncbi:DEAD/DEAH box helicase [Thermococcus sp. M36]|uniref:DEAD/DEAH box helicase n=1 Tax=Thermococcus sp. M36 TaxID=1638261 RepID=UPI001439259D
MEVSNVECYHALLGYEFKTYVKVTKVEPGEYKAGTLKLGVEETSLGKDKILSIFSKYTDKTEECFNKLLEKGFLVKVGRGYRSLHMDVAIRSAFVRTSPNSPPYVVSPRLALYEIPIPSKEDRRISPGREYTDKGLKKVEDVLIKSIVGFFGEGGVKYADVYKEFLRRHFGDGGLDAFQALALSRLLIEGYPPVGKTFIITAPTGSGKTEIFTLYMIAKLIKAVMDGTEERVVLVYPRKALSIDQAGRIIEMLKLLNDILREYGIERKVTFGIRDGETPRDLGKLKEALRESNSFRGILGKDKNKFVYEIRDGKAVVSKDGVVYDFIVPLRRDMGDNPPTVLVTNTWALETRLLDNTKKDIGAWYFENVSLVVFDEAHEYTGLGGALVSGNIELMAKVSKMPLDIVLSSATVPNPKDFAERLSGRGNVVHVDFREHVEVLERDYGVKFKGKRLVLMGIYDILPAVSWSTYAQLWTVYMSFLNYCYSNGGKDYWPKSLVFIQNIKEIRRVKRGFDNNISLGEPKDHLYLFGSRRPSTDPFSYTHYVPPNLWGHLDSVFTNESPYLRELLDRVAMMYSELPRGEREAVIKDLKEPKSHLATVLTTSSLELGVDYDGVSFILNVGFENPISLRQRIGRGGRSMESMRTVLGIILTKKVPTEAFLLYDPNIWDKLHPMQRQDEGQLIISTENPQVKVRGILTEAVVNLALAGEPTYASGEALKGKDRMVEFLKKVLDKVEGGL